MRRLTRFLSSARLATLLLVFVGSWSALASFVPQGASSEPKVAAWAAAAPALERVARALGLHQAFMAPLFLLGVVLLALSTALCAWQRTKVAIFRSRLLRSAASIDARSLEASHDLDIPCASSLTEAEVVSIAAESLRGLGIRTRDRGDAITAASPVWTAWGSPVFHWALLVLIAFIAVGGLARSSGLMGLAVGQTKADQPGSYGSGAVTSGPLYDWGSVHRSIRVDAFDVSFRSGGIGRGASPTVSVLDGAGNVVKTQRVYPNNTLKLGSLTVYPSDYGLSATVAARDSAGVETTRSTVLIDFSGKAEGGTAPAVSLALGSGAQALTVLVSVPLDSTQGGLLARLPDDRRARVVVNSAAGLPLLDTVISPGSEVPLPTGGMLRLESLGYYARLQLVDDPATPILYAGLVVAMIGLSIATLARQQIVSAAVVETLGGMKLMVRLRLWRNETTSRNEIETELAKALSVVEKRSTV